MTFDPGVGVPPTGAAASLAPRFLTVLGFSRRSRFVPSQAGTNGNERCDNSARPVSRQSARARVAGVTGASRVDCNHHPRTAREWSAAAHIYIGLSRRRLG